MERRKRLIVDPSVQARIVRRISVLPLVLLAVAAITMSIMASRLLDEADRAQVDLPSLGPMLLTGLTFLLTAGVVITLQSLRYSHAVAGPTFRLQQSIARLRGGDASFRVQLRRGDELMSLAEELNLLIESLERSGFPPPSAAATGDLEPVGASTGGEIA